MHDGVLKIIMLRHIKEWINNAIKCDGSFRLVEHSALKPTRMFFVRRSYKISVSLEGR